MLYRRTDLEIKTTKGMMLKLLISQSELVKKIAKLEGYDITTIKNFLKSLEAVIVDELSSVPMERNIAIKLSPGITIERRYIPSHVSYGVFKNHRCDDKLRIKVNVSRNFKDNINNIAKGKTKSE